MPSRPRQTPDIATRPRDGERSPLDLDAPLDAAPTELPRLISTQLIPQLLTSQRARLEPYCDANRSEPSARDIEIIVQRAMARDVPSLLEFLVQLMTDGLPLRTVLLDAIAPAARRLGEKWQADEISWTDTTVGLATLERVISVLAHEAPPAQLTPNRGVIALFAGPGEQHTLSIRIVGELFRHAGHRVIVDPWMTPQHVVELVQREHVEMLGMTSTVGTNPSQVRALADDVRRFSVNPNLLFVIGGPRETASYAREVGVTYCADAQDALLLLRASARARGDRLE
jgi:methanogenic corrinoid protein MtbC1